MLEASPRESVSSFSVDVDSRIVYVDGPVPESSGVREIPKSRDMIRKLAPRHGRPCFALFSKNGKRLLGTHKTLDKAIAQEIAIGISKARAAGRRIARSR